MNKSAREKWLPIKNYEGLYEISNFGNVKSVERKSKNNNGYKPIKERLLKPCISNTGYYMVSLCKNQKQHTYTIHKLVMEHFNRCSFDYEVINHIDHNKLNNNISNLEYVTQKENCIKAVEHGCIKTKAVLQFDKNDNLLQKFNSITEAHIKTQVALGDICRCCKGVRKSAGGFIWKYV
jgi:hypothetical protein